MRNSPSLVKDPLIRIKVICRDVMLGSKYVLSNNQSRSDQHAGTGKCDVSLVIVP